MHSVLERATAADLCLDPFPYLVIEQCLPQDYYRALADVYPPDELILELNAWRRKATRQNQRNDIAAARAFQHAGRLPAIWMEFIRYHSSQAFYAETLHVFGDAIRQRHPRLERKLGRRLEACKAGVRFDRASDQGQVSLDCQVGINTAVQQCSSVRRVHTDAVEELYAMLLYFRRDEDDADGGDLEIYRWRDGVERRFRGQEIDEEDAEYVTTIPYRANTLVAFINSEDSLHAVSARAVTPHSRRLVNLLGEVYRSVPCGLFVKRQKDVPPSLLSRLARGLGLEA